MITYPKLFFAMVSGFDLTTNDQLKDLSVFKFWDKGLQKYFYTFPIESLNEVIALTGKKVSFEKQKSEILNLIHHCPPLREDIIQGKKKGKGYLYIQKFPKIFRIITIISKKEQTFEIPVETVLATWKCLKKYPLFYKMRSKKLAGDWCQELGITRFNRQTGSFDGDKMYGKREYYFKFYYSLKVLQNEGLIKYYRSGNLERVSESWELEGKLE